MLSALSGRIDRRTYVAGESSGAGDFIYNLLLDRRAG